MKTFLRDVAWRLPLFVPLWARNIILKAILTITGLVVMPFMYRYRNTPHNLLPKLALLYANPEDWHEGILNYPGSVPRWYHRKWEGKSEFYKFYRYHAIRNPADGLRNFEWTQLKIDTTKAKYWTPAYMRSYEARHARPSDRIVGHITWQGWHCGMKWLFLGKKKYVEFKFGFRIEPGDVVNGLSDTSVRKKIGASMATKLLVRNR